MNRRGVPSGFSVGGSSGVDFGRVDEANRILNTLKNKYNYDPGGLDQFTRAIDNNKFFVRGDVNVSPNHRFTVRHNFIDATNDIGRLSLTEFFFPDYFYHFRNKTNSTVGQLNSTFGRMFNELRVNYQRVRDARDGDTAVPRAVDRARPGCGKRPVQSRARAVFDGQRTRPGHHRDHRRLHAAARRAYRNGRHAQRGLRFQEPVHPELVRLLHVHQRRKLRGGSGPGVGIFVLEHSRSSAASPVRRPSVQRVRGRSVEDVADR